MFYIFRQIIFSFLIFSSVASAENTILIVAEEFPRATNTDGTGAQFEIIKAILEPYGYNLKFRVFPYKRAIYLTEHNKADIIIGIYQFPTKQLRFAKYPQDVDKMVAIYPKSSHVNWQGISSLENKRISATPGFEASINHALKNISFHFNEVSTRAQTLKKLIHHRTDFMIDTEAVYSMEEINIYKSMLDKKNIGFFEIFTAFANNEKTKVYQTIWEREFPKFIQTKQAKSIYSKWNFNREYQIIREYTAQRKSGNQ